MNKGFEVSPGELSNAANNGINSSSNHSQTQGLSHSLNHNQSQGSSPNANHNQSTSDNPNLEWGDRCSDSTINNSSSASYTLDGAIANLIDKVSNFSDPHFDTGWMNLDEVELIELVALVIGHTTEHLSGQLLGGLLLHLRGQREAASPELDPIPEAGEQQEELSNPGG
jgi:hypothetical protein